MFGRVTGLLRRAGSVWRVTRRTVERVPDVFDAILILPQLGQQLELIQVHTARLEVIEFHTANLEEMREEIARLRGDTAALAEMALPLQGAALRVGRVADRWPARRRPLLP
jgi:predicted nuclease with TOPRIM domain